MANDYFRFKRFSISQSRCAMKVGTDGTLLGAWAHGGKRILDIGTGTGLIALMMAQRFPESIITGIDVDEDACMQAKENVENSPWKVEILHQNASEVGGQYDSVVSNPPFFCRSLKCPDAKRTLARHDSSLSYKMLVDTVRRVLSDDGEFSLIIPSDCRTSFAEEAILGGLSLSRECAVKTMPGKAPKRYLLAFRKHPVKDVECMEGILETHLGARSEWYQGLTQDFYL